ncbi:MAG: ELWxxDGT repeat protein [Thermoanaerobaculia bacterium]|jgi:ELWxxDGT repeat protein
MVADLRTGYGIAVSSSPVYIGRLGDRALLVSTPSLSSSALWITDGSEQGTVRLLSFTNDRRVYPPVTGPIVDGGTVVFGAPDASGWRFWKSDGTVAGTTALTPGDTAVAYPIAVLGGKLVFRRNRNEIWVHDNDGSRLLRTIDTSASSSSYWSSTDAWNGLAFLGNELGLWKSDGTEAGTVKISSTAAYNLTPTARGLFFDGRSVESGSELWVTDGSEAGTHLVADLTPGAGSTLSSSAAIRELGDGIFFVSSLGKIGVSDGSASGTRVLREGKPMSWSSTATVWNGVAYFGFDDGEHGRDLWKSDGTETGTRMVLDDDTPVDLGAPSGPLVSPIASGTTHIYYCWGNRLLRSDGTAAGTVTISSAFSGGRLLTVGDRLYFSGWSTQHGSEPWVSDGSSAGTHLIANLRTEAPLSSSPRNFVAGRTLSFFLADSEGSVGIWRTDGSSEATRLIVEGNDSYYPPGQIVGVVGDTLYFFKSNALWMVRPEDETPTLAKEFTNDEGEATPIVGGYSIAGKLLLRVDPGFRDETLIGELGAGGFPQFTRIASDVWPSSVATLGGQLYFMSGPRLYTTNGDEAGTRVVARIPEPNASVGIFVANEGGLLASINGPRLWRFSGSGGDVRELEAGQPPDGASASLPVQVGSSLLYRVVGSARNQLWALAGESASILQSFNTKYSASPEMVTLGQGAILTADDGVHGIELWYSDGTVGGTLLLRDINGGSNSSDPRGLFVANGVVYFSAFEPEHGRELWRTDGTPAGTYLVSDIAAGAAGSNPKGFGTAHDTILFSAETAESGNELWAYTPSPVPVIDIVDGRATEGSGKLTLEVRLTSPPANRVVTVDYRTIDGTARAGRDYRTAAGTLRFEPGTTRLEIPVELLSDETPDVTRAFTVLLENSTVQLSRAAGAGIIDDDDTRLDLQVSLAYSDHALVVAVRNLGPSMASDVELCWASRYSSFSVEYACESLGEIPPGGETTRPAHERTGVVVARLTQYERDTNPDNNRMSWLGDEWFSSFMFVNPPNPQAGSTGTIFLRRASATDAGTITLESTDAAVVSVPASVAFPAGTYFTTASFTAHKRGEATVSAKFDTNTNLRTHMHVLAPGDAARSSVLVEFNALTGLYFGANNHLQAFVRGATPDGVLPTGTVSFYEDARLIGHAAVTDQSATLTFRDATPGDHIYNAVYNGDSNFFATPVERVMPGHAWMGTVASVRATRMEDPTRVLITIEGVPGYSPEGTLGILEDGVTPRSACCALKPINDRSSTTIVWDVSPTARTLRIVYSGDPRYYLSTRHDVSINEPRTRPVRR